MTPTQVSFIASIGDFVSYLGMKVKVIGLFVDPRNTHYQVEWKTETNAINSRYVYAEDITEWVEPVAAAEDSGSAVPLNGETSEESTEATPASDEATPATEEAIPAA